MRCLKLEREEDNLALEGSEFQREMVEGVKELKDEVLQW